LLSLVPGEKTTSKDTLLHLIKSKFATKATTANHNTLLGVAFDILHLPQNTQYFIAEIGAYHRGDISQTCRMIKPKIGIITAVGPMHLERFGSLENILNTKMELAQSIPKNGQIFLPESVQHQIFHIHLKSSNIVFFKKIDEVYQSIRQLLDIKESSLPSPSEHRLEVIKNGSVNIIDDTYNSNPVGFTMALDKLKSLKSKNNILITPGMIELGQLQESENARLIKLADSLCQHLILIGQTNRAAFKSVLSKPKSIVHYVDNINDAQAILPSLTSPDSAILFENDLPDNYL
jgi:UDP-N-acetylmuramoyl-tripeptide--D-alanyl-D-alanine ligase